MKVELRLNSKGGFDCYQEEEYVRPLARGMNFTLICEETKKEKPGRIGFSWNYGYFWVSEFERGEKRVLSDGMKGILSDKE